jgi:Ca2+-binding EF-hand superfamily protein
MWKCCSVFALGIAVTCLTVVHADEDEQKAGSGKKGIPGFKKLDTNGDGKISKEEFAKLATTLGQKFAKLKDNPELAQQVMDKLFDKLDTNGDGFLSPEEFKKGVANLKELKEKVQAKKKNKDDQ